MPSSSDSKKSQDVPLIHPHLFNSNASMSTDSNNNASRVVPADSASSSSSTSRPPPPPVPSFKGGRISTPALQRRVHSRTDVFKSSLMPLSPERENAQKGIARVKALQEKLNSIKNMKTSTANIISSPLPQKQNSAQRLIQEANQLFLAKKFADTEKMLADGMKATFAKQLQQSSAYWIIASGAALAQGDVTGAFSYLKQAKEYGAKPKKHTSEAIKALFVHCGGDESDLNIPSSHTNESSSIDCIQRIDDSTSTSSEAIKVQQKNYFTAPENSSSEYRERGLSLTPRADKIGGILRHPSSPTCIDFSMCDNATSTSLAEAASTNLKTVTTASQQTQSKMKMSFNVNKMPSSSSDAVVEDMAKQFDDISITNTRTAQCSLNTTPTTTTTTNNNAPLSFLDTAAARVDAVSQQHTYRNGDEDDNTVNIARETHAFVDADDELLEPLALCITQQCTAFAGEATAAGDDDDDDDGDDDGGDDDDGDDDDGGDLEVFESPLVKIEAEDNVVKSAQCMLTAKEAVKMLKPEVIDLTMDANNKQNNTDNNDMHCGSTTVLEALAASKHRDAVASPVRRSCRHTPNKQSAAERKQVLQRTDYAFTPNKHLPTRHKQVNLSFLNSDGDNAEQHKDEKMHKKKIHVKKEIFEVLSDDADENVAPVRRSRRLSRREL